MPNDDLRILITGQLNIGKTIGEINAAIAGIEKKINKIKLQVQIPENFEKTIKSFIDATNKMKKIADDQNKVMKQHEEIIKKADGSTEKLTKQYLKNGEVIEKTRKITDQKTKSTENYTAAIEKQQEELEELGKLEKERIKYNSKGEKINSSQVRRDGNVTNTANFDSNGKLVSYTEVTDYYKQIKEDEKLINQMYEGRVRSQQKMNKFYNDWNNAQEKAIENNLKLNRSEEEELINQMYEGRIRSQEKMSRFHQQWNETQEKYKEKNINLTRDEIETEKKKEKELRDQLELYKRQAEIKSKDLKRRFGESLDVNALNKLNKEIQSLNVHTPEVRNKMKQLGLSFQEISANAKASSSHVTSFGEQLKVAAQRVPLWMGVMTAFYAPLRGMQNATKTLLEIDRQMTELQRVSDGQLDRNHILEESVALSERLGNRITEINEGLITFSRMGFRGDALIALTEASTMFSNISELNVDEASSGLTAILNGFQMLPQEVMKAVDAINEVDNNFAITSADIVTAMQKSVGAANTFGVTMEELIGMVVSIGEVSRESGNIIGNSLKTIFSRITTMKPAIDALASVDVSIRDDDGNLRDVSDILGELASKWGSLNKETQQYIALQAAGR